MNMDSAFLSYAYLPCDAANTLPAFLNGKLQGHIILPMMWPGLPYLQSRHPTGLHLFPIDALEHLTQLPYAVVQPLGPALMNTLLYFHVLRVMYKLPVFLDINAP